MAVKKDYTVTGRLPRKLSLVCSLFSRKGDAIANRAGGLAIVHELIRTSVHIADCNNWYYSLLKYFRALNFRSSEHLHIRK